MFCISGPIIPARSQGQKFGLDIHLEARISVSAGSETSLSLSLVVSFNITGDWPAYKNVPAVMTYFMCRVERRAADSADPAH